MTNTTRSTFTPSAQFIEAGEKAQAFANAGNALKPFLPQEAQQQIEGVEKVANALTATGQALEHFGFDEDADLVTGHQPMTNPTGSTFTPSDQFIEAGEKAQAFANAGNALKPFLPQEAQQQIEGVDKVAKAFTATGQALQHFGFDEDEGFEGDDPAFEASTERRAAIFASTPETILPLDAQSLGTTAAVEHQADPLRDSLLGSTDTVQLGSQEALNQSTIAL